MTKTCDRQDAQRDAQRDAQDVSCDAQRQKERRAFLKQLGIISGVAIGAGYAALAPPSWPLSLRDPDGERGKPRPKVHHLPAGGYALKDIGTAPLGIAHGKNIDALVRGAIDGIGGIKRYVTSDDVVVIKPNVAFDRPAVLGTTTNPEVLAALIRLVKEAGAKEIRVTDNPIESPESCFERSGIRTAALKAGARIILPSPADFELLATPGATHIGTWPFFWRPFVGATKVIGVAPVKDHNLCRASMTTKNWYGLLGGRRNQFHQDIHGIISDLALMLRPTFVLLDGSRVLFRSGPTGGNLSDVRAGNTIVASTDSLAADAFGWDELLGRKGEQLPGYFQQAAARKLGNPTWQEARVKRVRLG
ncbi:MAG: DUF362 domain-containing protein [Deltaproteobacteria bacterium]|nr:DUF362 domain-containing protein [Deltaproteobacteria bacterium]